MTTIKYPTKEEALAAVTQNGGNLEFCSKKLKNNKEVVLAAIKQNSMSFRYASDTLKNNKAFTMKALNGGVEPWGVLKFSNINIHSNIEIMTLALEKSHDGWPFFYAKGEVAINKELAAKALVKWDTYAGSDNFDLLESTHPTIQEFFPKDSWHEKAQTYLCQLEQEKQAVLVSGGSTAEDEVVW